jgi:predicted DsbA family dithiol-disulfide isomerase
MQWCKHALTFVYSGLSGNRLPAADYMLARVSIALYSELVQELGLSPAALRQAIEEGKYKDRVRTDFSSGVRSGVNGTPTFFINGTRHDGPFDYETLVLALREKMGRATP